MIVQPGHGEASLCIDMVEHMRFVGQLAAHYGNENFSSVQPRELMEFAVSHHDDGWIPVDANIGQDAHTGLPYNLVATPVPKLLESGPGSPQRNEEYHPFCGLLVSMHTYGLYHGRYGLSDKIVVDLIPSAYRPMVEGMLVAERVRQDRLKNELAADPETAPWVEEEALFHAYKQLQFFDTLALYFHRTPDAERESSTFLHVPQEVGEDVEVQVERVGPGRYTLTPYPFDTPTLELSCTGRLVSPQPEGTDMAEVLQEAPTWTETITLAAA